VFETTSRRPPLREVSAMSNRATNAREGLYVNYHSRISRKASTKVEVDHTDYASETLHT
jgi:hypothetical protein